MNPIGFRFSNGSHATSYPGIEPVPAALVTAVTGRSQSAFTADIAQHAPVLHERITSARILVIGAAGSIGAAFTKTIAGFLPSGLALLDINENGLADLVRDLRSSEISLPKDFVTSVVAIESPAMERFLAANDSFDLVLNFSAMKHVRSERDPYSLMRMIEINVLGLDKLLNALPSATRVFSVSSDKAANPASLMGATKRWMERILARHSQRLITTSARFANVAFSNGSLPQAFLRRLELRQPFAAPSDVRRYFISHEEAAHLCLLAAILGDSGDIFIPNFFTEVNATTFVTVAHEILNAYGISPVLCATEEEARNHPLLHAQCPSEWPCHFSASNTGGEKEIEVFSEQGESFALPRFAAIDVVRQGTPDDAALQLAEETINSIGIRSRWDTPSLANAIKVAIPELNHHTSKHSLDNKM